MVVINIAPIAYEKLLLPDLTLDLQIAYTDKASEEEEVNLCEEADKL